jgi:hypothetical protein
MGAYRKYLICYGIMAATYLLICLPIETIRNLTKEDGLVESMGALCFFLVAVLFFMTYLKSDARLHKPGQKLRRRNILYLLLSVLFFIACGEELSWGQRQFNIETPSAIKNLNVQKEINIHNIEILHARYADGRPKEGWRKFFNISRLFTMFWMLFCCIIPLLHKCSPHCKLIFNSIKLPITPIWIGLLFLENFLVFQILYHSGALSSSQIAHGINELKESNYAIGFMILAYSEFAMTLGEGCAATGSESPR